jgi:hypothetical protein
MMGHAFFNKRELRYPTATKSRPAGAVRHSGEIEEVRWMQSKGTSDVPETTALKAVSY